MAPDLKSLLTPELFSFMVNAAVPIDPQDPLIDFGKALKQVLFAPPNPDRTAAMRKHAWPALQALSTCGDIDDMPDLFAFLPPVEDPRFPVQALGLQLVLDQGARILCKGLDQRWCFGFLDHVCIRYTQRLQALPPHLRPSAWERWKDVASPAYYVCLRVMLGAPLVHSEETAEAGAAFTEETRVFVEGLTGVRDAMRDCPERWDLYGFPKMLAEGPPGEADFAEGAFWIQKLMDVHKPILDTYGRYPYRNWVLGREMRPEEQAWLDKVEFFKPPCDAVLQRILEDVKKGVWSPLGTNVE